MVWAWKEKPWVRFQIRQFLSLCMKKEAKITNWILSNLCLHVSLEWNIDFIHEFCAWNRMPSENFQHEIFSSENITTNVFHTNYLELKLMLTKIKQITIKCTGTVHTAILLRVCIRCMKYSSIVIYIPTIHSWNKHSTHTVNAKGNISNVSFY